MTPPIRRALLALLAATAALVGGWALFWPSSFYRDFPAPGRRWVSADGPFNEHLVRDVGALHLALLVVTLAALREPAARQVRTAAWAWLVLGVPHLTYHLHHLGVHGPPDQAGNVLALGWTVVAPVALLVGTRTPGGPAAPGTPQPAAGSESSRESRSRRNRSTARRRTGPMAPTGMSSRRLISR